MYAVNIVFVKYCDVGVKCKVTISTQRERERERERRMAGYFL
jgi:hypothetical protein